MPYIKPTDYKRASTDPSVPGELNYAMTLRALSYMRGEVSFNGFCDAIQFLVDGYIRDLGESYTIYNEVIGALECCGMELVRRCTGDYEDLADNCCSILNQISNDLYFNRTAKYEDQKIAENGDVFPTEFVREKEG